MKRTGPFLGWFIGLITGAFLLAPMGIEASDVNLAPASSLPQAVREASTEVQEAYRFAVANPELLKAIPCYCGCEVFRHGDNYACYVNEVKPDGTVIYSDHGLG